MDSGQLKINTYKSPVAAALWSALMPGFGQFYVRDYVHGFLLLAIELGLNSFSNLNEVIRLSFNGAWQEAAAATRFPAALFYPSVYTYNIWQAYNRAKEINYVLERQNVATPPKLAHHTGAYIGMMLGMFSALIWNVFTSPVISGIILGAAGAMLGWFVEKRIRT